MDCGEPYEVGDPAGQEASHHEEKFSSCALVRLLIRHINESIYRLLLSIQYEGLAGARSLQVPLVRVGEMILCLPLPGVQVQGALGHHRLILQPHGLHVDPGNNQSYFCMSVLKRPEGETCSSIFDFSA